MFHRKHPTRTTNRENTMTETFDRYSIPGMGPRIDLERGWLDFEYYPEQIAEKVTALRAADEAKLRELCEQFTDEKYERPVLPIEKQLLGHIGFRKLPGDLKTTVQARWMGRMVSGYYSADALKVVYTWPTLELIGGRQAPHLPQTNIRFHSSLESVALVAQVHKDAVIEAMKALDADDLEMARAWLDAVVAHCEHPTEGWA
ncbi:hypothetical protein RQCS_11910 [Rhodococcus qingshengii]|nr:hypothetical protein RQCS_11910 [Rhodococcus qingshengii]